MTKRTIKTTLGTYVGKRGSEPFFGAYGWKGDEVDVHEDFLEEFDTMNVETPGEPYEAERVGVAVISPETVAAQEKADKDQAAAEEAAQKKADEDQAAEEKAAAAAEKKATAKKAT